MAEETTYTEQEAAEIEKKRKARERAAKLRKLVRFNPNGLLKGIGDRQKRWGAMLNPAKPNENG